MVGKRAVAVLAVALAVTGCAAVQKPKPTVVQQATPNPLVGARAFQFAPVTFEGFTFAGKSEEEWLSKEDADYREGWKGNKEGATERILKQLVVEAGSDFSVAAGSGTLGPGQFLLAVNVDKYVDELGLMRGTFHGTLRVKDGSGKVIDEIRLPVREGGGIPSLALNTFVVWAAADTAEYLRSRIK